MTMNIENATPADLLAAISQACDPLAEMSELKTATEQIDHLLGPGWHPQLPPLEQWRRQQVKSVLTAFEKKHSKNLTTAKKHKELADMYCQMVESEFIEKAMRNFSKAIIWAPFTEKEFLAECLLARADLHRRSKNNLAALADTEGALLFTENSMLAIFAKVALLKRLDRRTEAYFFLTEVLKNLNGKSNDHGLQEKELKVLRSMKKELKMYKHSDKKVKNEQQNLQDGYCTLQVDPRLEWTLEQSTNRHVLKATSAIEGSGEILVKEEPALFIVREESLHLNCSFCLAECASTCWPCSTCTEVIYCQISCAAAAYAAFHRKECGILGALKPTEASPAQALQVYRHLAQTGLTQLTAYEEEIQETEQMTEPMQSLIGCVKVPRTQVLSVFGRMASLVNKRIKEKKPLRTANQLAIAIYLGAVYCYKSGEDISPENFRQLVGILATELVRVSLAEYGWYGSSAEKQRIHQGNYQCLVSSVVGHSCQPTADWTLDERNFLLTSTRAIKPGEEIVITYGPTGQPFFTRQSQLTAFMRMCHCEKCFNDAKEHFAIRCTFCNGPIPFDSDAQFTELNCLLCERKSEKETVESAKVIQADLKAMQQSVWLVSGSDESEQAATALDQIEKRMTVLATVMPTNNRLLLLAISNLCEEYLRRSMISLAVEWFQWLASTDIYLDIEEGNDIFILLYHINKWTKAYLDYLPSLDANGETDVSSYIEVLEQLVQRGTTATKKLKEKKVLSNVLEESQVEQVVEMMQQQASDNLFALQKICVTFSNAKMANCSTGDVGEADF